MRHPLRTPLPLLMLWLLAALAGCAAAPARAPDAPTAQAATTVYLVRHAEKADGDDPALTAQGRERAMRLGERLRARGLQAVYATGYRRTQETAALAGAPSGLSPQTYDAREPAPAFVSRLAAQHPGQAVLVVGHSNTVPALAAALCRCQVAPMDESEYDRLLEVRLADDGPSLQVHRD